MPPSAVETFSYPAAAQIWSNQKIKLIRGDGHIVLADCDATGSQIKVLTVTDDDLGTRATYCFQATASTGYLALEVPRTFYLTTSDHPVAATLTADGRSSTVTVPKNDYQPVGEGTVGGAKSTLVELRIAG
ncbi:hypothetical protein ABZ734_14315 [Streptomyces sp. NPDC006660]|uniref:hypothetical protein n=1 Tax=Streptomyces sp. NPDC006660 TaxID=3156901 RepID=UPI0033C19F70